MRIPGRRAAGVGIPRQAAGNRVLPHNAAQQSYASYHLAYFRNASDLALQLGHQNTEVLFGHYRELVTPEAAALYWEIQPAGGTNLVPMEATG